MLGVPDETEQLFVVEIGEENNDTIDQRETVVEIESSEEQVTSHGPSQCDKSRSRHEKKKTEVELLKTSLYSDLGLYFNDVMKGKFKAHQPPKDLHVDHIERERRNIIWVNPLFPSEPTYTPMAEEDRNPFIRLVFTIVCFNLMLIIGFELLVVNVDFFNELFRGTIGMLIGILGLTLMGIAEYIIVYEYGRTCPCTGIAWVFAVIGSCWFLAYLIVKVKVMELIIAFVATLAVVLLCIGLACTSFDFTRFLLYVLVIGLVLSVFSLGALMMRMIFGVRLNTLYLILACGWAIYHSLTLIIEIQMVIGGHSLEIDSSQYILGGVMITLSIVHLFINILKIVMYLSGDGD